MDDVPFALAGQGQQAVAKIVLALRRHAEAAGAVMVEEPENHLSHANLKVLLDRVNTLAHAEQQVFIKTHSSFVLNRFGVDRLRLVSDGTAQPFEELPSDTVQYFRRIPGFDTLRLVLVDRLVLVEGPSDEVLFERFYRDRWHRRPIEDGIDVFSKAHSKCSEATHNPTTSTPSSHADTARLGHVLSNSPTNQGALMSGTAKTKWESVQQRYLREAARLASATRAQRDLPWLAFKRRRALEEDIRTHRDAAAQLAQEVADDVLRTEFRHVRRQASKRNAAHPEALPHLEQLARDTANAARRAKYFITATAQRGAWAKHDDVLPLLTAARAEALISQLVEDGCAVAADPEFLFAEYTDEGERSGVVVQHRASGLRAQFWATGDGTNDGRIASKPYQIKSIDPEDEHPSGLENWERYAGLGIGKRLYLVGASLLPHLRWGPGATQTGAIGARIALHAADPYRWYTSSCPWCNQQQQNWKAPRPNWEDKFIDDFAAHPRTPMLVPPATLVNVTEPRAARGAHTSTT